MRIQNVVSVMIMSAALALPALSGTDDPEKVVRKAVERSTLNQPGRNPFT
jgi:hypothetical protein